MGLTFDERLTAICARMRERRLDLIVAVHDGAHFIETPNPVMVLCGFKSLGPAICLLDRAGATTLIVAPAWDADSDHMPYYRLLKQAYGKAFTALGDPEAHVKILVEPAS